jgi:GntR family transcriptional regulator
MASRFAIDPKSPVPLHAQIAEQIQLAIATGALMPGDQLPTVRQLSVDLKVNSNTVARVYAELERGGVLETHRGRGTFVRPPRKQTLGARERRRQALCRAFLQACSKEGFTLEELVRELAGLGEEKEGSR